MEDKAIDEMASRITESLATEIVKKLEQGFKKQELEQELMFLKKGVLNVSND